ncbi:MAG: sulfite exporter TauE/SafE family protein, partial [Enhydrobacter sp.]
MSATDPALWSYALVLAIGTVAGLVSGIVGTGATIILLPVLALVFGPKSAIPIMAIVA